MLLVYLYLGWLTVEGNKALKKNPWTDADKMMRQRLARIVFIVWCVVSDYARPGDG